MVGKQFSMTSIGLCSPSVLEERLFIRHIAVMIANPQRFLGRDESAINVLPLSMISLIFLSASPFVEGYKDMRFHVEFLHCYKIH